MPNPMEKGRSQDVFGQSGTPDELLEFTALQPDIAARASSSKTQSLS